MKARLSRTLQLRLASGVLFVALVAALLVGIPRSEDEHDPWLAFRPLLGEWKGEAVGFGAVSDVTHEWKFVISGHFMELRTRSVQRREGGPGEVHEDVGFLSRDSDRNTFVFRQFLSEGFVNTFDVSVEGNEKPTILFDHREAESAGGMQARMRLTLSDANEYELVLDLAMREQQFKSCQQMQMKKVE